MRLIDADALIDELTAASENWRMGASIAKTMIRYVKRVPTIDAAPVVHGRWEYNGIPESVLSKCSVCGCLYGSSAFNYCPNCGAKMDLEVDDK